VFSPKIGFMAAEQLTLPKGPCAGKLPNLEQTRLPPEPAPTPPGGT